MIQFCIYLILPFTSVLSYPAINNKPNDRFELSNDFWTHHFGPDFKDAIHFHLQQSDIINTGNVLNKNFPGTNNNENSKRPTYVLHTPQLVKQQNHTLDNFMKVQLLAPGEIEALERGMKNKDMYKSPVVVTLPEFGSVPPNSYNHATSPPVLTNTPAAGYQSNQYSQHPQFYQNNHDGWPQNQQYTAYPDSMVNYQQLPRPAYEKTMQPSYEKILMKPLQPSYEKSIVHIPHEQTSQPPQEKTIEPMVQSSLEKPIESSPEQQPSYEQHLSGQHLNKQHLNKQHLTGQHLNGQHLSGQHLNGQHLNGQHLNGQHLKDNINEPSFEKIVQPSIDKISPSTDGKEPSTDTTQAPTDKMQPSTDKMQPSTDQMQPLNEMIKPPYEAIQPFYKKIHATFEKVQASYPKMRQSAYEEMTSSYDPQPKDKLKNQNPFEDVQHPSFHNDRMTSYDKTTSKSDHGRQSFNVEHPVRPFESKQGLSFDDVRDAKHEYRGEKKTST